MGAAARPGAADERRREVLARLDRHVVIDPRERRALGRVRALVAWLPHPFDESADPTHVTASAIVTDGARVVLHRHKRLGRWMQPGGHVDPGERPAAAALRETREETGLQARHPDRGPTLLHVDVHEGGRGHLHLDLRFLLRAAPGAPLTPAVGESQSVGWFDDDAALDLADAPLLGALRALRRRRALAQV